MVIWRYSPRAGEGYLSQTWCVIPSPCIRERKLERDDGEVEGDVWKWKGGLRLRQANQGVGVGIIMERVQFGEQGVGIRIGEVESMGPRVFIVMLTISNILETSN
jgi:hypothetical protein